jgi:HAE1 family hydrophobic/amphiphilic exporter-1
MVPVALGAGEGAAFRKPLGIAVIGGVITSTLLTLLVIPTFYELLDRLRDRSLELAKRMFRSKRAAPVTGEYPVVEAG